MKKQKRNLVIAVTTIIFIVLYVFLFQTKNMDNIEQVLISEIESGKSPSLQYFLFNEDSIIHSYQLGLANISQQRKTDASTTYHAYSITKTFTALAVLQLAEQGKLDIDKPAVQFLPDFPYGGEITVRQLMNHTAGIPNPIPLSWIHLVSEHNSFNRNNFFKPIIDDNRKVKSKPNDKFSYTNLGYIILGQLIEKISGKTYEEFISENILKKLNLNHGDLGFEIHDPEKHAVGYHKKLSFTNLVLGFFIDKSKYMVKPEGKWRPFKSFYINGTSYGGLIGKPSSFVKYVQALMKENNSLISEKYRQMLFEENKTNDGKPTGMCLSWWAGELNGKKYFSHAGGGGGYYCEIRIYPAEKTGSVIFFNRTGMSDQRFLDKTDQFYFERIEKKE